MEDSRLRHLIYRYFAEHCGAPPLERVAAWAGGEELAREALSRLHDGHAIVLDEDGSVRMALPFSAVETSHRVVSDDREWWANCAWDTLAIPAALGVDALIEAAWLDTGEPVGLEILNGDLNHTNGFIHFAIPARHWWDDIVET